MNKIIAFGFICFWTGAVLVTKNFTHTALIEPFTAGDKFYCIIFAIALLGLGYIAGREDRL